MPTGRPGGRARATAVLAILILAIAAASVGLTSAYLSATADGSMTVQTAEAFVVAASVDIKPESLQVKSEGEPVMAFVTLPEGLDAADVDAASIGLCLGTQPCTGGVPAVEVHQHDGPSSFRARFDQSAVIELVEGIPTPADVTFTVSGLVGGFDLRGERHGQGPRCGVRGEPRADLPPTPDPEPSSSASPTPDPEPSSSASPTPDPEPSSSASRKAPRITGSS